MNINWSRQICWLNLAGNNVNMGPETKSRCKKRKTSIQLFFSTHPPAPHSFPIDPTSETFIRLKNQENHLPFCHQSEKPSKTV